MKVFVSSLNIPVGYSTPRFPSLYWPLGAVQSSYQQSFLYYSIDIWKFTVYWSLILYGAIYLLVGTVAAISLGMNHYRFANYNKHSSSRADIEQQEKSAKKNHHPTPYANQTFVDTLLVIVIYAVSGAFQGFISGAVVGVMLSAIYKAGSLPMSCWIPLTWGIASILFNICSSYRTSSLIL